MPTEVQCELFQQKLKRARLNAQFGMRHFAEAINMLPSAYCDSEHGRRPFTDEEWDVIVTILGLPRSMREMLRERSEGPRRGEHN